MIRRYLPLALFVLAAALANILTTRYGFVPVGFGYAATAGTYAAGFALVARDYTQDTLGLPGVAVAIALGAALSFLTADARIAAASAVAFALSEVLDACVYTPLRQRHWRTAIIASSIVGAIVDTAIFLGIAFGTAAVTWNALTGQLIGKVLWIAIPVALIGGLVRRRATA